MLKFLLSFMLLFTSLLFAKTKKSELSLIHEEKTKVVNSFEPLTDKDAKETIRRIVDSQFNLHSYKENYFLPVGYRYNSKFISNGMHEGKEEYVETEFQVSVRYDFAPNLLGLGEFYSFGYTQRSWWQVYTESAFFRESNYQPEFFVTIPTYKFWRNSYIKGFKLAFIHQSNGRGGDYERSWNRISLSTYFQYKNLLTELELWYRLQDSNDYNPTLIDYIGYGQLRFLLPYKKNLFKLTLRSSFSYKRGCAELTYSYPIREENDIFLYFKTFNGYGESLIDYNHRVNKVSLGIAISR